MLITYKVFQKINRRTPSFRDGFPVSPHQSFRQVSQVQVHRGRNVSSLHSLLLFLPPKLLLPPSLCVTAWRYYDRGGCGVVMAAGWTARLCAGEKDSLSEREQERESETQVPPNSWAHAPAPATYSHPPTGLSNTSQTLGTPRISHSSCSHTYTHQPHSASSPSSP